MFLELSKCGAEHIQPSAKGFWRTITSIAVKVTRGTAVISQDHELFSYSTQNKASHRNTSIKSQIASKIQQRHAALWRG